MAPPLLICGWTAGRGSDRSAASRRHGGGGRHLGPNPEGVRSVRPRYLFFPSIQGRGRALRGAEELPPPPSPASSPSSLEPAFRRRGASWRGSSRRLSCPPEPPPCGGRGFSCRRAASPPRPSPGESGSLRCLARAACSSPRGQACRLFSRPRPSPVVVPSSARRMLRGNPTLLPTLPAGRRSGGPGRDRSVTRFSLLYITYVNLFFTFGWGCAMTFIFDYFYQMH